MIEQIRKEIIIFEKLVEISITITDAGVLVFIAGGDLSHIGAVSVVNPVGKLCTEVFEGHKDQYVSEMWADRLYRSFHVPVAVSVGIHYDEINAAGIEYIVTILENELETITKSINHLIKHSV